QAVAVGNLANLDTPGYRAKEVKFADALEEQLGGPGMVATDPHHFGTIAAANRSDLGESAGLASRRDGNNVQLDHELLGMTKAAADFSAAQTILSAKFRLVRYAINEGR